MTSDKNVKLILQVLLYLSVFIYVLIAEVPRLFLSAEVIAQPKTVEILGMLRLVGLLVSFFLILNSFKWRWLLKLLLGKDYIAGKYQGSSEKVSNSEVIKKEVEEFEIIQTLITTKITGTSHNQDGTFKAKYFGKLIDVDDNNFRFFVVLQTSKRNLNGIMDLVFTTDTAKGFGIGIEVGNNSKWRFDLKKI